VEDGEEEAGELSPLEEQFTSLSKTVSYPALFTNKPLLLYTIFRCLKK
jgi:hypothetical protein